MDAACESWQGSYVNDPMKLHRKLASEARCSSLGTGSVHCVKNLTRTAHGRCPNVELSTMPTNRGKGTLTSAEKDPGMRQGSSVDAPITAFSLVAPIFAHQTSTKISMA